MKRSVKRLAAWMLPYAAYLHVRQKVQGARTANPIGNKSALGTLLSANAVLRDRHAGQRCFVLCNGPSVKQQDLSPLSSETVISVSNGYLHPLYSRFQPKYHCVPQVTYAKLSEQEVIAWFHEMDSRLGSADVFLSSTEEYLVSAHRLFPGRVVRYVHFDGNFDLLTKHHLIDISKPVPGVQSVAIMCLMIAIYMGFREIYLLGADHDQFKTGRYEYFYEPTLLKGKDTTVAPDGTVLSSRHDEFIALSALWQQYRAMRLIAAASGIEIFNATRGGELDEFRRVRFEGLFSRKHSAV